MRPNECQEGVVVSHAETGAVGIICRGGYRPRVQWYPNGRTVRTDENLLRFIAEDEIVYRRMIRNKNHEQPVLNNSDHVLIMYALAAYCEDVLEFRKNASNDIQRQIWEEMLDRIVTLYAKVEDLL